MFSKIKKYRILLIFIFIMFLFCLFSKIFAINSFSFKTISGELYNVTFNKDISKYAIAEYGDGEIYLFDFSTYSGYDEIVFETTRKTYFFAGTHENYISINSRVNCDIYKFNKNSSSFSFVTNYFRCDNEKKLNILYSNINIYLAKDSTGLNKIGYINNITYSFYLEYNENLKSYVVYSQWYGITDNELYSHQHYYKINPTSEPTSFNKDTYDLEGWLNMEGSENEIGPGAEFNEENDKIDMDVEKVRWRVGLKIIDYGTYYFVHYLPLSDNKDYEIVKFVITEDGQAYTETLNKNSSSWSNKQNITEISTIRENITSFNMYAIYDSYSAIIYSNYFRFDDRYTYTVSISYDNLNYSDDMLIDIYGHIPDEKAGYYRFYKEVTENRTYYFRLRVFDPETGGSLIDTKYTTVVVNGNFYLGSTIDDVSSYRKSAVYKLLKNKLGILFYPIDIIFEFFERLSKVEFGEPSISVPTVREYFTGAVIINGFTFNLNSVLQNDTINQVYNIYLMFVDFIIYILIFGFLYKVFREFFNIGGLFNG